MGCSGGKQGVLAHMELEKISQKIKDIIIELDQDLEINESIPNSINSDLDQLKDEIKKIK